MDKSQLSAIELTEIWRQAKSEDGNVVGYNFEWFWYSYAYWTVHHLDSWIKTDQIDVTCFIISLFNVQHVSDVLTSETCWALNNEIIKQVTSSWSLFIQLSIFW